jgi:hypothetical protein
MLRQRLGGNCLEIIGDLDESASGEDLLAILSAGRQVVGGSVLKLDLSGVAHANSLGIRNWLTAIAQIGGPLCYVRMPIWLVAQFNMIRAFTATDVYVESLYAPFYCSQTKEEMLRLLYVTTDVPLLESYEDFEFPSIEDNNFIWEPDFDPAEHFSFLTLLFAKKSSFPS